MVRVDIFAELGYTDIRKAISLLLYRLRRVKMSKEKFYQILKVLFVGLYSVVAALSPALGGGDFEPSALVESGDSSKHIQADAVDTGIGIYSPRIGGRRLPLRPVDDSQRRRQHRYLVRDRRPRRHLRHGQRGCMRSSCRLLTRRRRTTPRKRTSTYPLCGVPCASSRTC